MEINYDIFLEWAEKSFDKVVPKGDEIMVNSIFTPDDDMKLWCNPKKNCYHCWKSGNHSNLYDLVSQVDKCTIAEAVTTLGQYTDFHKLEDKVREIFAKKHNFNKNGLKNIGLPKNSIRIIDVNPANPLRIKAEKYLLNRKIPFHELYICSFGREANRIIIPYYDREGRIIYWNSRTLVDHPVKYLGPKKDVGVGKMDVIWMSKWEDPGNQIYLCEGEFDAMSLRQCGRISAATGGKELHDKQIDLLSGFNITLCYDTDRYGKEAIYKAGCKLLSRGFKNINFVRCPTQYKDWNAFYVDVNNNLIINHYINKYEQEFNSVEFNSDLSFSKSFPQI